ncbi:hypothetical protein Ahy_A03g012927 isoform B [Arachis hypogaea]|nr:hypothetical protein Ahy_A03g012927 isoform B [Arachis hypogaea]
MEEEEEDRQQGCGGGMRRRVLSMNWGDASATSFDKLRRPDDEAGNSAVRRGNCAVCDRRIYLTKLTHLAYCIEMSNQELINAGMKQMDETDQAIERSKQVVHQTIEVGTQTATTLKGQTEQMGRIVNELDSIQFSIKKASQLVKEIGRQVATDKCIMLLLVLIVCGVIAIIVVKIVNPHNKDIRDIPGLAPPAPSRRLLYLRTEHFD